MVSMFCLPPSHSASGHVTKKPYVGSGPVSRFAVGVIQTEA